MGTGMDWAFPHQYCPFRRNRWAALLYDVKKDVFSFTQEKNNHRLSDVQ
jgi:hypothetical protein